MTLLINTAENIDYLDSLIGATIVLFILSLITEKLVEFIRKYFIVPPEYNKFNLYRNINAKTTYGVNKDNEDLKYKKKKEISALAILIGIFIALFANASLFDILSSSPQEKLFWPNGFEIDYNTWFDIPKFIFGILFTGFFLSFGSKFFHDLLDILYQTKEYKRKLLNKELYEQESASGVVDFINADSHDLAEKALALHGKQLKLKYSDLITSLEIGNTVNNQIGIIANLKKSPPSDFPKDLIVKLKNGNLVKVEIEAIIDEIAEAHYGLDCRVSNVNQTNVTGAFGGVILTKDDDDSKYFLTCSHVALSGNSIDKGGFDDIDAFNEKIQVQGSKGDAIGELVYAKLDETNDTAIIKLGEDSQFNWSNALPEGNNTLGRAIAISDMKNGDDVAFYSSKNNHEVKGKIHKVRSKSKIKVKYDDGIVKSFVDLIVVGDNFGPFWSSLSEKGDSGSILYDVNHRPFGLIIAGNNKRDKEGNSFTYAIPIKQILDNTNTKIYQP